MCCAVLGTTYDSAGRFLTTSMVFKHRNMELSGHNYAPCHLIVYKLDLCSSMLAVVSVNTGGGGRS